jgi:quinol monooxygenase YgiN
MAQVQVIARFVAREGKENQLRALLQSMLAPTRAESGCELYELYESDSWGRFFFCETWASQAALDQHMATPTLNAWNKLAGNSSENPSRSIS